MPTFDFRCRQCSHAFEGTIPFGSKEYPPCPKCDSAVEKLLTSPLGIVFKGKGFYKTDSSKEAETDTKKPANAADAQPIPQATEDSGPKQ